MAVIEAGAAQSLAEPRSPAKTIQSRAESRRATSHPEPYRVTSKPSRAVQSLETPRITQNLTELYKSHAGPSDCQ